MKVCVILIGLLILSAHAKNVPVIGILSKPIAKGYKIDTNKTQIIDGAYISFLEAGGAKVAYINYNDTNENLRKLFTKLNGVLFQGGSVAYYDENDDYSKYLKAIKLFMDLSMEAYDKGDYFPVWGTCLGFEMMLFLLSEDPTILKFGCNCSHYNPLLEFTDLAEHSRFFSRFSPEQIHLLKTKPMTYNNHFFYISPQGFQENKKLTRLLNLLATSKSIDGERVFVTAVEGKKYPIYAVQFHPEKNAYLFGPKLGVIRTKESIEIMQEMSSFFVSEAKKSMHTFETYEKEAENLVYRGELVVEKTIGPVYIFK